MSKYCVPIVYRGLSNFVVEASSKEQAIEAAKKQFADGETPVLLGNESEEIDHIGDVEILP